MEKQTKAKTGVLARRIAILCLSIVVIISIIFTSVFLVNLSGITDRNLRTLAELNVKYLNIDVLEALTPALDLVSSTAAMVPMHGSLSGLTPVLHNMMLTVPVVGELYYGTALSRFDGGSFILAGGADIYSVIPTFDQTTTGWFIDAKNNPGKIMITDPYVDTATAQLCITAATAVTGERGITGVVGADIYLDVLTEIVTSRKITQDGNTFIIDKEGLYLIHQNHDLVMQENFFTGEGRSLKNAVMRGTQVTVEGNIYWASMPVTGFDWYLVTTGTTAEFMSDFWRVLRLTIILALIISAAAIVVSLRFSAILTNPIKKLFVVLQAIAAGDFTQKIESKGKDEISQMSLLLRDTQESLKKLIKKIKDEASILSDIGSDLANNMNETAKAMNDITANVDSINKKVLNQSASVSETHATMEQVVLNINKVNNHVEDQSNNVAEASSAIEEMVANINSVTATLVNNVHNVHELSDSSEAGRNGLQEVVQDIQEISRESEGLLEINAVMENIASQTNLLSMNAAIEAAHAGEAGKGFAVVASEIRKLAENSSTQSKTIGTVLKKIKASIDKITGSTQNVMSKFEAIESGVKKVSTQEENIRNAMEEQGVGSKQILEGVGNVNEITRQVKTGSNEMLAGSKEVIKESENLEILTQEISSGMNEMTAGAKQVNTAVNHVNEISKKNSEAIDGLIKEVARFKV